MFGISALIKEPHRVLYSFCLVGTQEAYDLEKAPTNHAEPLISDIQAPEL